MQEIKSRKWLYTGIILVCVFAIIAGLYAKQQQEIRDRMFALKSEEMFYVQELGESIPTDGIQFIDEDNTSEKMMMAAKENHVLTIKYKEEQLITVNDSTYLNVGDYEGSLQVNDQTLTFTWTVVDTTTPIVSLNQESVEFEYGTDLSEYNWNQYLGTEDASNKAEVTIDQSIDSSTAGTYDVVYHVQDPSGNKAEDVTLKVIIKEKPKPTQSTTSSSSGSSTSSSNSGNSSSSSSSSNNGTSGLQHWWKEDDDGNKISGTDMWLDQNGNIYDASGNSTGENIYQW